MQKIYNFSIVSSFLGLWVATLFSENVESALGFILIFSFGIMHGSNDILLIDKLSEQTNKRSLAKVLGSYILILVFAFIAFYFVPMVTLILFILFSGYHFGEQHWEQKLKTHSKILNSLFYLCYGLVILFFLLVMNADQVIEVIKIITNITTSSLLFQNGLITVAILFIVTAGLIAGKDPLFIKNISKELFYLLIFGIVFKMSSLIWGFTIYFILWHSIPSLFDQVHFIYGQFGKNELWSYFKKAFPYWLISIIGVLITYGILKDSVLFYAVFFSFIAAVTFPHSLIISRMFKSKKNATK
jgi:Brp/Blh family beta-carotene 15,15'-monooxygenase